MLTGSDGSQHSATLHLDSHRSQDAHINLDSKPSQPFTWGRDIREPSASPFQWGRDVQDPPLQSNQEAFATQSNSPGFCIPAMGYCLGIDWYFRWTCGNVETSKTGLQEECWQDKKPAAPLLTGSHTLPGGHHIFSSLDLMTDVFWNSELCPRFAFREWTAHYIQDNSALMPCAGQKCQVCWIC